jgi:hypothetical protein
VRRLLLALQSAALLALLAPGIEEAALGDEPADGCPADVMITTDCVSPIVTIDKGPRKQSNKAQAKFTFTSDEAGSTFSCSVDGKSPKTCASPFTTKKLRPGKHTFGVRATDVAGNQSTEALYKWKVKKKK